jgi:glutamate---cysteine ligase / carboxylate-amine ligase
MDAVSRVEDAVALTAYVQALVRRYTAADEASGNLSACHPVLAQENNWRAARYGLQATVVALARGGAVPIAALIERTLEEIAPYARELDFDRELAGVRRILDEGNGADRQRRALAAGGDPRAVACDIATVTRDV